MMRHVLLILLATTAVAHAKPAKLVATKFGKVTIGVPEGYKAAVGERCIAMDGPGSLLVFRTVATRADLEKSEAGGDGVRVERDKMLCFVHSQPGENARCVVTTAAGNVVTQFVSFGKKLTALGGADTMLAIVESIQGWDGKPDPAASDCPVVPQ
jgi:hypothetical protein